MLAVATGPSEYSKDRAMHMIYVYFVDNFTIIVRNLLAHAEFTLILKRVAPDGRAIEG